MQVMELLGQAVHPDECELTKVARMLHTFRALTKRPAPPMPRSNFNTRTKLMPIHQPRKDGGLGWLE